MNTARPDPTARRHRSVLLWISIAALVLAGAGWSWLRWGPGPSAAPEPTRTSAAPCPAPTGFAARATAPAAGAPDGGAVRLVESGFHQQDAAKVGIGAIIENTSTLVAYRTRVTFRVYDDQRRSVVLPGSEHQLLQEIPVILPGQRIGAGALAQLAVGEPNFRVTVAAVELELGSTQWWPAGAAGPGFAAVTAAYQKADVSQPDKPEAVQITYSADSAYCFPGYPRQAVAVFRNAAGAIVGGVIDYPHWVRGHACAPGQSEQSITSRDVLPPTAEISKTEVYLYCDLAPADPVAVPRPAN